MDEPATVPAEGVRLLMIAKLMAKRKVKTEEDWLRVSESPKKDYTKGLPECPLCHDIPCSCED